MSGSETVEIPTRTFFQLLTFLESRSGRAIDLALNRNRVSYVSFKRLSPGGRVEVRLQQAFLMAPEKVLYSLARWIASGRGPCPAPVRRFISGCSTEEELPCRRRTLSIKGDHHDLGPLLEEVNREYFQNRLNMRITWGRQLDTGRRVYQRQLGSCDRCARLVTISRVLDHPEVPRWVLEFVIFHEMLHAVQPADTPRDHDREFCAVERMHPDFQRYLSWQKRNMNLLMNPGRYRPGRRVAKTVRDEAPEHQGLLF